MSSTVISIELRPRGEIVWRCSDLHPPGVGVVAGNRWDGRVGVNAAVQRHFSKYHTDRRAATELRRAWAVVDQEEE